MGRALHRGGGARDAPLRRAQAFGVWQARPEPLKGRACSVGRKTAPQHFAAQLVVQPHKEGFDER